MKKITLLSLLFSCLATALFAQNPDENIFTGCATDLLHRLHPELREAQSHHDHAAYKVALKHPNASIAEHAPRTLPVVVHIIHNGGTENIPDALVQQGIAQLNAAFNASFGTGFNTEVQFCLAQRDPNGQATTGITRDQSVLTSFNMESQDLALKDLNRWTPTCYINIWVVSAINSVSSGNGVVGYAYFPSAHGSSLDGIVMEAAYFGSSQANTGVLVHEMGHYLGLYHTFEGGCTNNDCLQDGDRVCDTPPDQTTFSSCNPNANSCGTDADDNSGNNPFTADVADLGEDYMDYSTLQCFSKFTQGQSERMNWFITNVRSSLFGCLSCQTPCPAPLSASITLPSGAQTIPVGSTLNFSASATNATNYAWNINTNPAFSTNLNTNFTFNTVGTFWVKFRAISSDPLHCADALDSVQVTVICDAQAVFSVPPVIQNGLPVTFLNSSSNATSYEWVLDNVQVSTSTDLNYTFVNTGVYQLCLRAINANCTSTLCATVYVQGNGGPSAGCDNTFIKSLSNMGGIRPNIFPHPNGDFFATGLRNDSMVIVRFDQGGAALWAKAFRFGNDVLQIRDMFVDVSGDLIGVTNPEILLTGQQRSMAFRYNLTSNTFVWIKNLATAQYTQIHPVGLGDCVLTGSDNQGSSQLIQINKNTGAISGYNLLGEGGEFYSSLYNGSLYGATRRYYNANGDFRASLFAHNLNTGAFQWQNSIISVGNTSGSTQTRMYPEKPIIDNDNLVVLTSGDLQGFSVYLNAAVELVAAKTSLTGNVQWTKQYVISGNDRPVATAIVATASGYYMVCNLYQASLGDFGFGTLIKTDKQGNVQWAKRLGISGKNIVRNVMERNGYLYLTMSSDSYGTNDLLLVKLDEQGNTNTDCDFVQPITVIVVNMPNIQNQRNYTVINSGPTPVTINTLSASTSLATVTFCNTPCLCPEIPLSAGADTTICLGQSVTLQATPGLDQYDWSPAATLDNPNIQNPVATPSATTTYTLNAIKNGVELIENPDFTQGNTSFTSGYISGGIGFGHYNVTNNPLLLNNQWIIPQDHSPSADNLMLMIDGDNTGSVPPIWQQTVLVQPNTDYKLEFWGAMAYFSNPPKIQVKINGNIAGTFDLLGGNAVVGIWQSFSLQLNSFGATQFSIELTDLNTASIGNDFALDDISLRSICHYSDNVTVTTVSSSAPALDLGADISACTNAVHTFDAGAGYANYLWQDGSINRTFTSFATGTYWVTVRDSCGGIQQDTVQVTLAPSPTVDLGPDQVICAGNSVPLSYTSNGVLTSYHWSPSNSLNCSTCPGPVATPPTTTLYYFAGSTADGCTMLDSITVVVNPPTATTQNIKPCDGEPFIYNGNVYTSNGVYTEILTTSNGCDSVVTIQLTFVPLNTRAETINFCPGESVNINGVTYSQPGTVVDTLLSNNSGCDTIVIYTLQYQPVVPSVVSIICPTTISIAALPGAPPMVINYNLPSATSNCPCPGTSLTLTAGLASGALFPAGLTTVCYAAQDSCGNSATCCFNVFIREELPCDVKENICMKYELLTITADSGQNYTYRIRVTNKCAEEMIYTAIELPSGTTAIKPLDLSVFDPGAGRLYDVRNPNASPFYSIRFKTIGNGISGGQAEIFRYTLPAQTDPLYINIGSRLASQAYYEAHLNTFNCPIGVTPDGQKPAERSLAATVGKTELRIFPNPSTGELYVDLADWSGEKVQIRVLNLYGQQMDQVSVMAGETPFLLHMPDGMANGLYILECSDGKKAKRSLRFVLQW
ncbi:MAG: HYR domain-containing protein [Phycisphaerae bacterium]|nr:HYR domain-containing protein [Saprospiraceae bacterium]